MRSEFRKSSSDEFLADADPQWHIHYRFHPEQTKPLSTPIPADLLEPDTPHLLGAPALLELLRKDLPDPLLTAKQVRVFDIKVGGYVRIAIESKINLSTLEKSFLEVIVDRSSEGKALSPPGSLALVEPPRDELARKVGELEATVKKLKHVLLGMARHLPESALQSDGLLSVFDDLYSKEDRDSVSLPQLGKTHSMPDHFGLHPPYLAPATSLTSPDPGRQTECLEPIPKDQDSAAHLHFAILYSRPLVELSKSGEDRLGAMHLANEPVNFSEECSNILKSLKKHSKEINVRVECATEDEFLTIVKSHPTVLHVMCHGSYDVLNHQHYLEFENEDCELLRLTPAKLRMLLQGDDLSSIKVVFVNACHSEVVCPHQNIGRVFLEFNVKCLIVVSAGHKVSDDFATKFSEMFYSELLTGSSVQLSFDKTMNYMKMSREKDCHTCCCGHEHKPWCRWMQKSKAGKSLGYVAAVNARATTCTKPTAPAPKPTSASTSRNATGTTSSTANASTRTEKKSASSTSAKQRS